jgi:rod shape-determining protein MreD
MALMAMGAWTAQVFVPPLPFLGGAKCPFLLSLVIYHALARDTSLTMAAGLAAGLLQDVSGPQPLGCSSACFCVAGFIVRRFHRVVLANSLATRVFFGGVCAACVTLALYVWLWSAGLLEWPLWRVALRAAGTGLLGAVCAPIVCFAAERLDQAVGNTEVKEFVHELGPSGR